MSQQDFGAVVSRARQDRDFATELFRDPEGTLKSQGLTLTPEELQAALSGGTQPPPPFQPARQQWPPQQQANFGDANNSRVQQEEMAKFVRAQSDRMIDLGKFTSQTLKDTIQHATGTYKKITMMNQVLFWMGIALFIFAVVYAVYSHNLRYSIAFAGLGTASFIGTFLLGPLGATQGALSDLISAEIAFMSYFEQIFLIEAMARIPCNENSPMLDPHRVERASDLMHLRSVQTADLLHRYINKIDKDNANATIGVASAEAATAKAALSHL